MDQSKIERVIAAVNFSWIIITTATGNECLSQVFQFIAVRADENYFSFDQLMLNRDFKINGFSILCRIGGCS